MRWLAGWPASGGVYLWGGLLVGPPSGGTSPVCVGVGDGKLRGVLWFLIPYTLMSCLPNMLSVHLLLTYCFCVNFNSIYYVCICCLYIKLIVLVFFYVPLWVIGSLVWKKLPITDFLCISCLCMCSFHWLSMYLSICGVSALDSNVCWCIVELNVFFFSKLDFYYNLL